MTEQKQFKPYPDGGSLRSSSVKKGAKSPDYWGSIAINLKDMTKIEVIDGLHVVKLSGWKKVDGSGKTYLSIAVDRFIPEQQGNPAPRQSAAQDDDVPF
jgi:hypothetical protein